MKCPVCNNEMTYSNYHGGLWTCDCGFEHYVKRSREIE